MADYPPFMNAYGNIPKILNKIKEAKTPQRFTHDFLATNLGHSGGSARPFIPFAKRLGLLSSDGTPTELYQRFRDASHTKTAMARAIRTGYSQLYDRNEFAHKLDKSKLEGLIIQITGLDAGSPTLKAIAASFDALKPFADFESSETLAPAATKKEPVSRARHDGEPDAEEVRMNLAYTINLNLPRTDDIAVFNAIFKALRENLLRK